MNCPASFTPLMVVDSSAEARTDAPLRPQVEITVDEARAALATMAEASPDHAQLAAVVDALLVRLDTVRDECLFRAQIATTKLRGGDASGAQETLANIVTVCGKRGERHTLTVNAKRSRRSA